MILYTIGHSNHLIDKFIQLLQEHSITTLVDVRSVPYSRFNPQYNKLNLQRALAEKQVEYVYMGEALGGRPADPTCYIHGVIPKSSKDYVHEISYPEVMKRSWFIEGIRQLIGLADKQSTAILCSEADPAQCHRHHLITMYLLRHHGGVVISHILKDGSLIDAKTLTEAPDQPVN